MNDRAPIRDRTLVLRILVPGLETRLRDKMKEMEETAAAGTTTTTPDANKSSKNSKELYLDLDGVTCEPTAARNRTLWNFHCDGATYPAKLINLPCPVEIHKTHDHAAYYKSADVAQMLIVYEDDMALEEAEEKPVDGFPSYHHSGLTPPMKNVVERRFAVREHKAVAPPRAAVADVEAELVKLMDKVSKKDDKSKRSKAQTAPVTAHKVLEEVVEEIVDYEPWMESQELGMEEYKSQELGVEFDADNSLCMQHPEVWLSPETIQQVKSEEEQARKKKQAALDKKEAKRREKKKLAAAAAAMNESTTTTTTKKGIASKKNTEVVDDITQAAASIAEGFDIMSALEDDDDIFGDIDLKDEILKFDEEDP